MEHLGWREREGVDVISGHVRDRDRMRDGCAMDYLEKYMRFQKVADHAHLYVRHLTSLNP